MPAGNGNVNLDTSSFAAQWRSWPDSGSIIVGAGSADLLHQRMSFSTYGQRVGPQGWGDFAVVTTGGGDLEEVDDDVHRRYTAVFSGTSSATPMVAGAALLTQQHALNLGLTALDSLEMRAFLQRTGVPQGGNTSQNIGAFIDLRTAVTKVADADADLAIVTTTDGSKITTTVVNQGPRTADSAAVTIIYHNPSVHSLVADDVPASCSFSAQVPIPAGALCPGQCPSLLECDFTGMAAGQSKIIRFDVDAPNHPQQFHIQSDVSPQGELLDPRVSDNVEDIIVTVTNPGSANS